MNDFISVDSSSIRALADSESQLIMTVQFQDGEIYEYSGVQPTAYAQLLAAPSVGQYFNSQIRNGSYACRRVGHVGD